MSSLTISLIAIALMIISIPITRYISKHPDILLISNFPKDIRDTEDRGKKNNPVESKFIGKLSITDELITKGFLTINHTSPVKFWVTSEDLSNTAINWDKVESTLDPGTILYPKTNTYIWLHAENDTTILETSVYFDFYDFVEYSIRQRNDLILQDMFYSLEDSDVASYTLNDSATDLLTKYNASAFFRNITNGYEITHIEFQTAPDILSSNYPKIKQIKCSKKF